MHRILFIQEILFNIFGHCSPASRFDNGADLAVLARTCQAFKEPALDVLWEELRDLSPLIRCLPEVCFERDSGTYEFSRPPSEAEWNTLRIHADRVRSISVLGDPDGVKFVLAMASPTSPLFPNLRSLVWDFHSTILPVVHTAVPSLTSLHVNIRSLRDVPSPAEFLDAVGERCPNMTSFTVSFPFSGSLYAALSRRQLCRWTNLRFCRGVTLDVDTVLHLPSMSTLTRLSFTLSADLDCPLLHLSSLCIFSSLASLGVQATSLSSVTNLFSRVRLPAIEDLTVVVSTYTSRRDVSAYWTAIQKACPSDTLSSLTFFSTDDGSRDVGEERHLWLTLDALLPYRDFGNLCKIAFNVPWSVRLTDADVLDLVSTSPRLEDLLINHSWGWRTGSDGGGITLSGLVQLLQQCPSLVYVFLAIDAKTFTQIPHGLDMSLPPRKGLFLNCLDSFLRPEWVSDMDFVFGVLGVNDWTKL